MTGKYQAYADYKDSETQWLGDVPVDWGVKRTKAMFSLTRELVGKDSADYQLLSLTLKGVINRDISDGSGKIPAEFDTYQVVRPKSLIFCLFDIDETPRTVGISQSYGMITGAYNVYTALDSCIPEYAYYYFLHIDSFKGLKPFYTGLRKVVRSETFSNIKMPAPSPAEQEKIADFLDHETAKIDTLIAKQQQLIALLKEKRQAVISHAVSKGLNPNAPMRDSGVELLGEVPAHWDVKPLKHIVIEPLMYGANEAAVDVNTENVRFVRITDVREDGSLREETFRSLDDVLAEPYLLAQGDVLLARTGGTVGKSFIYDDSWGRCCFAGYLIKARIDEKKAKAEWFYQYTSTKYYWEWIASNQIQATLPNVSADKYNGFVLAIPPVFEQVEILEKLKLDVEKLDYLIKKAELAIELMQERRTALISAAVTGKIDVRSWQAPESMAQVEQ